MAPFSQIMCERSIKMTPPTGPPDLKLCVFYNWQSLHELVAAPPPPRPRLIHSSRSRGDWRPPGVSWRLLLELWATGGIVLQLWELFTKRKKQVSETNDSSSNLVPNCPATVGILCLDINCSKSQMNLTALAFCDCKVGPEAPAHHPGKPKSVEGNCCCHPRVYLGAVMLNKAVGKVGQQGAAPWRL